MIPRIMGIETEFGLTTATPDGSPTPMEPEAAAQILFRRVLEYSRSTNIYLANGSRLYLDVGAHPEYATAECDNLDELIAQDRAGEEIYARMTLEANDQLAAEGSSARIHLIKNNVDSAGNSFGCHENYLIRRRRDFRDRVESLVPYFVTRQILAGAGYIRKDPAGSTFNLSQRADQVWDAVSSATTRSRPIVNTRDEPHGDAELYRRLHVIVGDSNMSEATTALKVGATEALLTLVDTGKLLPKLALADPMAAIRAISQDLTGTTPVELEGGRRFSALEIQREFAEQVWNAYDDEGYLSELDDTRRYALELWLRALDAFSTGDLDAVSTELDWVAKYQLLSRYRESHGLAWDDPRVLRLDLAYHDISHSTGLARSMASRGLLKRIVSDDQVENAIDNPPATTRASLRGRFVRSAQNARRDFMVDWMNLRLLETEGARSLVLKDPFASEDSRVDELIERMG